MHFPFVTIFIVSVALRWMYLAQRDIRISSTKQCIWNHSWNDMFGVEGFDGQRPAVDNYRPYLRGVSRIFR
jgi:hypothetical protein